MNKERQQELPSHPAWKLFQEILSPDTPEPVAELLHQYYEARLKVLEGDREGAKEIYMKIDPDLLDTLEEEESGDINFIGVILTGTNIFDAPNKLQYFDREKMKAILPEGIDPSSN